MVTFGGQTRGEKKSDGELHIEMRAATHGCFNFSDCVGGTAEVGTEPPPARRGKPSALAASGGKARASTI